MDKAKATQDKRNAEITTSNKSYNKQTTKITHKPATQKKLITQYNKNKTNDNDPQEQNKTNEDVKSFIRAVVVGGAPPWRP